MQRARDGSALWWGTADAPGPPAVVPAGVQTPITVAVSPVLPGHSVTVDYRVDGGAVREAPAVPQPRAPDLNAQTFRALLPGQLGGVIEYLPVLRFVGQPISARIGESAQPPRYLVSPALGRSDASPAPVPVAAAALSAGQPRWNWDTTFLGCLTAVVYKEVVGPTPDGLRIDMHVTEGSFVGPGLDAVVLPGATDWMRIRRDGVAIVSVQACFQTQAGVRIYGSYGGIFDLGPDGYARALRDEFDPLPPVVVTPTYLTADKGMEWLNRAQCIGVGRVDMAALRVEFDVYVVRPGGPIASP